MRTALLLLTLLTLVACSGAERSLLVDPSDVDFDYGASVRQARLMQTVPAKTDPLTPVEGVDGKIAAKTMESFINEIGTPKSDTEKKAFLFYEQ